MMIMVLAWLAASAEVTAIKVTVLAIYDENGAQIGTLSKSELPKVPLKVDDTNDFGFLEVTINGRRVFIRPADVRHTLSYCTNISANSAGVRRGANEQLGAAKPTGVRRGAAEDGKLCIPN